jgi:hypothetical protein
MSGSMWAVFAVSVVGILAWEAIKKSRGKNPAEQGQGFAGARKGKPPHPHAAIIDMPGGAMRIIDLRRLPGDDLRVAKLGLVQEQLLLERPIAVQIWVAPVDAMREWAAMSETALIILQGRFRDSRSSAGKNYLYPFGGTLTEVEEQRLSIAGVEIVRSFANLSDPPKSIEDFLDPAEPWTASPDDRPVPPHDVLSTDPFDGRPIRVIEGFAFVDLRRLNPNAWQNGVALERLEKLFPTLAHLPNVTHVVWVVAPWVLERIDAAAAGRIEKLVDTLPSRAQQRLAVMTAAGETFGDYPLTTRLRGKVTPLAERLSWRTEDPGAFDVHPIEALHDAYFVEAWKKPRL